MNKIKYTKTGNCDACGLQLVYDKRKNLYVCNSCRGEYKSSVIKDIHMKEVYSEYEKSCAKIVKWEFMKAVIMVDFASIVGSFFFIMFMRSQARFIPFLCVVSIAFIILTFIMGVFFKPVFCKMKLSNKYFKYSENDSAKITYCADVYTESPRNVEIHNAIVMENEYENIKIGDEVLLFRLFKNYVFPLSLEERTKKLEIVGDLKFVIDKKKERMYIGQFDGINVYAEGIACEDSYMCDNEMEYISLISAVNNGILTIDYLRKKADEVTEIYHDEVLRYDNVEICVRKDDYLIRPRRENVWMP